jgi:hypothetical protein
VLNVVFEVSIKFPISGPLKPFNAVLRIIKGLGEKYKIKKVTLYLDGIVTDYQGLIELADLGFTFKKIVFGKDNDFKMKIRRVPSIVISCS